MSEGSEKIYLEVDLATAKSRFKGRLAVSLLFGGSFFIAAVVAWFVGIFTFDSSFILLGIEVHSYTPVLVISMVLMVVLPIVSFCIYSIQSSRIKKELKKLTKTGS
jgi:hypothetical protein